ncbi:hypothetical protein QJS10_CPB18g00158 [Acorus calamus]|uniref:Uncharacterized protein n=1 Tax=Acorus calamus TaxID=4465 RepID=A0AAV9CKY8_ACOCL|nr:hypothetical protein QJS10_CPB18g00158 [Acorus calamus]
MNPSRALLRTLSSSHTHKCLSQALPALGSSMKSMSTSVNRRKKGTKEPPPSDFDDLGDPMVRHAQEPQKPSWGWTEPRQIPRQVSTEREGVSDQHPAKVNSHSVSETDPDTVIMKLESLTSNRETARKAQKDGNSVSWDDLIINPHSWRDMRMDKLNGRVHPKYPDFENKDTKKGLWLSSAPGWVLPKLEGLVFEVQNQTFSEMKKDRVELTDKSVKGNISWTDLVKNQHQWKDKRTDKLNGHVKSKYPDFIHKETGEGLWLDKAPAWVLMELKGMVPKAEKSDGVLLSKKSGQQDASWTDLVNNTHQWMDKRSDKINGLVKPNYPDFKNKVTGEALWLNSAPDWVLPKLEGLVFGVNNYGPKGGKVSGETLTLKSDQAPIESDVDIWKDLVENPKDWWDNRSKKLNPKAPDFKNKHTGKALWLNESAPSWVLSKFAPVKAIDREVHW